MDDMTFTSATAVPEPSSVLLLLFVTTQPQKKPHAKRGIGTLPWKV